MPDELQITPTRKQVAIRLLYTLLYVAIFELVKTIVLLITLFEYFILLITLRHNEPARTFGNKVAAYGYRVMRYLTLIPSCSLLTTYDMLFSERRGACGNPKNCRKALLRVWQWG